MGSCLVGKDVATPPDDAPALSIADEEWRLRMRPEVEALAGRLFGSNTGIVTSPPQSQHDSIAIPALARPLSESTAKDRVSQALARMDNSKVIAILRAKNEARA